MVHRVGRRGKSLKTGRVRRGEVNGKYMCSSSSKNSPFFRELDRRPSQEFKRLDECPGTGIPARVG